jgi:hypothetical protein
MATVGCQVRRRDSVVTPLVHVRAQLDKPLHDRIASNPRRNHQRRQSVLSALRLEKLAVLLEQPVKLGKVSGVGCDVDGLQRHGVRTLAR